METPSSLWTAAEVAEALGVKVDTVRVWRMRGTGPDFRQVGRAILYNAADVWRWQQERAAADSRAVQEFGEWLEASSAHGTAATQEFVDALADAHRQHTEWRDRMVPKES